MQIGHQSFGVLPGLPAPFEQFVQPVPDHRLPLAHLHRMYPVFAGNLGHRFDPKDRFHPHLRFEGGVVFLALRLVPHWSDHFVPDQTRKTITYRLVRISVTPSLLFIRKTSTQPSTHFPVGWL